MKSHEITIKSPYHKPIKSPLNHRRITIKFHSIAKKNSQVSIQPRPISCGLPQALMTDARPMTFRRSQENRRSRLRLGRQNHGKTLENHGKIMEKTKVMGKP
jgi:hypothetical protein